MERTPKMQKFVDDVAQKFFGRKMGEGKCVTCGSEKIKSEDFRDSLSWKEFTISGMCQECQDKTFGK